MVKPPPKGFVQYKKKGRYYLRCANTIQTPNGVIQCSYVIRKDTQKTEHKCRFCTLDCYKSIMADKEGKLADEIAEIPLAEELLQFICETSISFHAACSPAMMTLLRSAFNLGKNSSPAAKAEDKIPNIRRQAMTALYIKKGANKRELALSKLKGCYSCITLDASTDVAQSCLDICVCHPFLHPKPIVINSISSFGGTTNDYRIEVLNSVQYLREKGIKVGGITSDNCKAQVQAISQRCESSFQYLSENPEDKTIIWISCICHLLALGVNHFLEEPDITENIADFKKLVIELRRKPIRNIIQATCVAPSNTRWNVLFLQMFWMIKHSNELVKLYKTKDDKLQKHLDVIRPLLKKALIDIIPVMIPSLQVVSAASREAEADSYSAAYIIPLMADLTETLKVTPKFINQRFKDDDAYNDVVSNNQHIVELLTKNLSSMFEKHSSEKLLRLMYIMTPEGRSEFRFSFPDIIVTEDPKGKSVGRKNFNKRSDELGVIVNYFDDLQNLKEALDSKEEMLDSSSVTSSSDSSEEDSYSYESSDDLQPPNELQETKEHCIINADDPTSFYIETLVEQLILTNSKDDVDKAVQSLLNWLMLSTEDLHVTPIINNTPVFIWTFLKTKEDWKILSDFALRCFSLVASEAGVERIFSQHKHLIGNFRRNTSPQLRIARLNMKIQ